MNWRGKPLVTYEVIVQPVRSTKTNAGLKAFAMLDKKHYEKGKKFPDEQMASVHIRKHALHPAWNHTIAPNIN